LSSFSLLCVPPGGSPLSPCCLFWGVFFLSRSLPTTTPPPPLASRLRTGSWRRRGGGGGEELGQNFYTLGGMVLGEGGNPPGAGDTRGWGERTFGPLTAGRSGIDQPWTGVILGKSWGLAPSILSPDSVPEWKPSVRVLACMSLATNAIPCGYLGGFHKRN